MQFLQSSGSSSVVDLIGEEGPYMTYYTIDLKFRKFPSIHAAAAHIKFSPDDMVTVMRHEDGDCKILALIYRGELREFRTAATLDEMKEIQIALR